MNRISGARRAVATVVVLAALAAASCGTDEEPTPSPSSTTTPAGPSTPPEVPDAEPGHMFTPNSAIVGARPIPIDSWRRVAPDRIAVNFQVGSPQCYGVDATTTETADAVTVDLHEGTLPEAAGRMCTMIAVFGTVELPLKQPLGDRKVLSAR